VAHTDDAAVRTLRRRFQSLLQGRRPNILQAHLRDAAAHLTIRASLAAADPNYHPDALAKLCAAAHQARCDMLQSFGLPARASMANAITLRPDDQLMMSP
jgi:hypothetical protein